MLLDVSGNGLAELDYATELKRLDNESLSAVVISHGLLQFVGPLLRPRASRDRDHFNLLAARLQATGVLRPDSNQESSRRLENGSGSRYRGLGVRELLERPVAASGVGRRH